MGTHSTPIISKGSRSNTRRNHQIMRVKTILVLPYLPATDDLLEWELSDDAKSIGDLKNTYHVFENEIDYILEFIESGRPRNKRHHSKLTKIHHRLEGENCPICLVDFRVAQKESRFDWDLRSVEHIISLDFGGVTNEANSILICRSCNFAFSDMIRGWLPLRVTIHGDGRIGGKKKKGDSKRKRIRTPKQISSMPNDWKERIYKQHLFQRIVVHSVPLVKRDLPNLWNDFWKNKLIQIEGSNRMMMKNNPDYIPTEPDFSGLDIL